MRRLPLMLLMRALLAQAEDFTYKMGEDDTITIIEYNGPSGDVTIQGTINSLPVTSLEYEAFCGRSAVTVC